MEESIHFENDLYFLKTMIRTLSEGVKLKIDALYFSSYVFDQIVFIHETTDSLYNEFNNMKLLFRKKEILYTFLSLKKGFILLLDQFIEAKIHLPLADNADYSRLRRIEASHMQSLNQIKKRLNEPVYEEEVKTVVTASEMDSLLSF